MPFTKIKTLLEDFTSVRAKHNFSGLLTVNPFRFSDPLLCKDLERIFCLAQTLDFHMQITTNGVALRKNNAKILSEHSERLLKLNVSIIGHDEKSVQKLMGISLNRVIGNLIENVAEDNRLRNSSTVSLRYLGEDEDEQQNIFKLKAQLEEYGFLVKTVDEGWITNRVVSGDYNFEGSKPKTLTQSQNESHFVGGCDWGHKLVQRIEVNVDGDVLLCCDDAENNKILGNVFETPIEKIWTNSVIPEHERIFSPTYSNDKQKLICSTCSRACWLNSSEANSEYNELYKKQRASYIDKNVARAKKAKIVIQKRLTQG